MGHPRCARIAGAALAALACCAVPAGAARGAAEKGPPRRIASINLCTDQYLLAMAPPSQIAGLSPFARDSSQSWLAERAGDFPLLSGGAEDVLALAPDLVVAGRFTRRETRELLREKGIRVEEFDSLGSIEIIRREMLRFGEAIGRREAAAAEIAAIDAALLRARAVAARRSATALPVQRRGWVEGEASLMTSLMAAAGLKNAAVESGLRHGGLLSLEEIVALDPDFLIVAAAGGPAADQGSALLLHPALARRYPPERRILLPETLTVCGGPMLVEALDRLTAQIGRLLR